MDIEYERVNITLPKKILSEFKEFCQNNGINISSRIAILIKNDLEKKNLFK